MNEYTFFNLSLMLKLFSVVFLVQYKFQHIDSSTAIMSSWFQVKVSHRFSC